VPNADVWNVTIYIQNVAKFREPVAIWRRHIVAFSLMEVPLDAV